MDILNSHNLPLHVALMRVREIDPDAQVFIKTVYDDFQNKNVSTFIIESSADVTEINNAINGTPIKNSETVWKADRTLFLQKIKTEYQQTLSGLQQIDSMSSMTNAQSLTAIKFLAKSISLILNVLRYMITE